MTTAQLHRKLTLLGAKIVLQELNAERRTIKQLIASTNLNRAIRNHHQIAQPTAAQRKANDNGKATETYKLVTARKRKKLHWTQRPENATKLRRILKRASKVAAAKRHAAKS